MIKEKTIDFYSLFCLTKILSKTLMLFVLPSQYHQEQQNSLYLHLKTLLEIIVSISTIVFIIFNLVKDATSNLMIVMLKFIIATMVHQVVLYQLLDSLLIQLQKHPVSKMQELNLQLVGLIGSFNANFMDQIKIFSQESMF